MDLTKLSSVAGDVEPQLYVNKYEPAAHDDTGVERQDTLYMVDLLLVVTILLVVAVGGYFYTLSLQ